MSKIWAGFVIFAPRGPSMWFVLHTPCISNVTGHCGSSTVAVDKLTLKGIGVIASALAASSIWAPLCLYVCTRCPVVLFCFVLLCMVRFCCQKKWCRWDWGLMPQSTEVETHLLCVNSCCGTCEFLLLSAVVAMCAAVWFRSAGKTQNNRQWIQNRNFWHGPYLVWVCTMLVYWSLLLHSPLLVLVLLQSSPNGLCKPEFLCTEKMLVVPFSCEIAWVSGFDACRGDDTH